MKKNKITLNEELNRMRHLFSARSGTPMTNTKINETYLIKTNNKIYLNEQAAPLAIRTIYKSNVGMELYQGEPNQTAYAAQSYLEQPFVFLNTPFAVTIPQGLNNVTYNFLPTNTTNSPLQKFYDIMRNILTLGAFQNTGTITMNNQPLPQDVANSFGNVFANLVRVPLETALQNPPFNLQIPNTWRNFNWSALWNGYQTNNLFTAQNVANLRAAITTCQRGLSQFTRGLENPSSIGIVGATGPIRGFIPPQVASLNTVLSLSQASLETNDSVTIYVLVGHAHTGSNKAIAEALTRAISEGFIRLIAQARSINNNAGITSSAPITIPSLQQVINSIQNPNLTNWDELPKYLDTFKILDIHLTIGAAFPNLINLPQGITQTPTNIGFTG